MAKRKDGRYRLDYILPDGERIPTVHRSNHMEPLQAKAKQMQGLIEYKFVINDTLAGDEVWFEEVRPCT